MLEIQKDGELFKWDEVGKNLKGVLVNHETKKDTGKGPGELYEVKTKEGVIPFFAPSLLHKKLKNVPTGYVVDITYVELSKTKSSQNDLKIFEVAQGKPTPEHLAAVGLEAEALDKIEDEDIDADDIDLNDNA